MERPDAGLLEGPLSWRRPGCGDRVALLRELDLTAATACTARHGMAHTVSYPFRYRDPSPPPNIHIPVVREGILP